MQILRIILTVIYVIDCIALTTVVLMQEGKQKGLGVIGGGNSSDTYWGQNKMRSKEGVLIMATRIMAVLFIVLSLVLNMNF
ncbi:MAG TPA: preprotein translocase subunit SecG [Lachnospiraceae bacterium]|nr:preprotein translocase subunit SecG [Lachnospiraceae bacterium]